MEHLKDRRAYKKWLTEKGETIDNKDLVAVIKNEIKAGGEDLIEVGKTITLRREGDAIQVQNAAGEFVDFLSLPLNEVEAITAGFITGDPKPKKILL